MTAAVTHVYTLSEATAANPTITATDTPNAGDVMVLLVGTNAVNSAVGAVSGLGATWSRVSGAWANSQVLDVWVGTGATASGVVTTTGAAAPRALTLLMLTGTTGTAVGVTNVGAGTISSPSQTAGPGQVVIGLSFVDNTSTAISGTTPATDWTQTTTPSMSGATRFMGTAYRAPTSTSEPHSFTAQRSSGSTYVSQVVIGDATLPTVKARYSTVGATTANPTVAVTQPVGAGDVLLLFTTFGTGNNPGTAVSGCGATWTKVANTLTTVSEVWIGRGATTTGTVTHTATADNFGRTLNLYHVANTTGTVVGAQASPGTATPTSSPVLSAGNGQIVFGTAYTVDSTGGISGLAPASGWTQAATQTNYPGKYWGQVYRAPAATANHSFTSTYYMQEVVLGDIVSSGGNAISSALSGAGTLTSSLAYIKRINSALSGSGTLTAKLRRNIASNLSGSGTLTSALAGRLITSNLSGSGTLTSALRRNIRSALSGSGALTSSLAYTKRIASSFSGEGTLTSSLVTPKRFRSDFSGEGVLFSELGYVPKPAELGTTPLGKLASFTVSTSAVPLNPAEGSGAAPSVNAGYIKGLDPEFALGESNVLSHGAVGTYEGEIVRLSLPQGSDVATIAQDTVLTLLNNEMHLFPFIDAAPSKWTAARAIDYWTQQAGVFYDKVPGDCIAYASGFGHTDAYGAQTSARFYEKVAGDPTSTTVLNNRSVKTLGSATTGTTAFHELPGARVAVSVPRNRKLVASIGLGLRGAGRTASVTWNMVDDKRAAHNLSISATSDGLITAAIGGVPVDSTTVPSGADYRVALSIERLSSTAVIAKLTVHTDDLAGNGELQYAGNATVATYAVPTVMYLTSIKHAAAGGSGTQMLRWGTYLTVAKGHPAGVPAVQKELSQTGKAFGFVSGFEGNVWSLLNEYCAITRQDIRFLDSKLLVTPRIAGLSAPRGNFSGFSRDSERREKYKQVAVVNKQSRAVATNDAVLWRADSVYQIAAREVFETTVQTGHSILNVVQPVAVNGITPFPYQKGAGQYVVTGADGYIIAPQWWKDNGGKVEVSLTGKEGEIAIKITAPGLDTVRAPYRISEGEADRPALYVCGSGILNDPVEVHVGTGAKNAREGFDNVFESPFIAGTMEAYDTAAAMAAQYSASMADVSFELPNDFYTPSRFGQFPAGTRFTDGKRNYRIASASQTHSKVSGTAVPHTTIGDYVASYPPGATIADEKKRHFGRTIRQFNIQPLRGNNAETA